MKNLNKINWKTFIVGEIFEINSTKSGININKIKMSDKPTIPYITRSGLNNGVKSFIGKKQNIGYDINKGNTITIGTETQTIFYQPYDFYTGISIQTLNHKKLNKNSAFFIIGCLEKQMEKFSWSSGLSLARLKKLKINLPMNKNGNLNWTFMEKYIEEKLNFMKINIANTLNKK